MNITVDISQSAYPGTGVARYTYGLVKSLITYAPEHTYTFFFSSLRKDPPKDLVALIKPPHRIKHYHIPPTVLSYLWNKAHVLPIERFVGPTDIYISSDWTQAPTIAAKKITVVHDLVVHLFPETSTTRTTFDFKSLRLSPSIVETHKRRLEWVRKECDHIIVDSSQTKEDLRRILRVPAEKLSVVYPPVHVLHPTEETVVRARSIHGLSRPFIMSVGKIEPRKNIRRLIEAFIVSKLYKEMDLVIVGAHGWGKTEIPHIPEDARTALKFLGFVSDNDLFGLYRSATLFAMPSLYEGFGYPVIEAMSMGCPVAASKTSSVGELAKGFAELFDPKDVEDIARALKKLATNEELKRKYAKRGIEHAQKFSYEKFAHGLQKACASVV